TRPSASAQNMNASSGSGLWPRRMSTAAEASMGPMATPALSESIQDYLKAIYQLQAAEGVATVSSLAERLGVSRASVSAMAKKLAALGLVAARERYRAVALTPAGEQIAVEVIRHHRLLELYLAETLGVAVKDVH